MTKTWKKILGVILIILGIPGLILPILPGIVLIVIGLSLFGSDRLKNLLKK